MTTNTQVLYVFFGYFVDTIHMYIQIKNPAKTVAAILITLPVVGVPDSTQLVVYARQACMTDGVTWADSCNVRV